jgi:hypothetical protein
LQITPTLRPVGAIYYFYQPPKGISLLLNIDGYGGVAPSWNMLGFQPTNSI